MKQVRSGLFAALFVFVALFSACSGTAERPSNTNTAQSNSNPADQSSPTASSGTPLSVQPIAPPENPGVVATKPVQPPPPNPPVAATSPADKPSANGNASTSATPSGPLPKLVAPDKQIDFGKQPQDKTLVRAITIRNSGRALLNIESVTPS